MRSSFRWGTPRLDGLVVFATLLVAATRFLLMHAHIAPRSRPPAALARDPNAVLPGAMKWWGWWDQGWYDRAATAWAHGATDPGQHWYLPGYPLLGAPFVATTPLDPFLVPDLCCFLLALLFCFRIAARVLDAGPATVPIAAAVLSLATLASTAILRIWVTPWSTTPEAVGFLGALLAVIGVAGSPRPLVRAALAGFAAGAVIGFRPADGAIVAAVVAGGLLAAVPRRGAWRPLAAAAAGAAVPLFAVGAAYLAVWGPHPSAYLVKSGRIGFEPDQLPLRWVTLMLDPNPLYPGGRGLAEAFPWVLPGLAGLVAAVAAPGDGRRLPHGVIGAAVLGELVLFLCYRDLHPDGLWVFDLFHYFKAILPVLALYAARFCLGLRDAAVGGGRFRGVLAGLLTVAGLLFWHVALRPVGRLEWGSGNSVVLPDGLQPANAVAMIPGRSTRIPRLVLVQGEAGGRPLVIGEDVVIPDPGPESRVLPLLPLRRLPAVRTVIRITSPVALDRSEPPLLFAQEIRFGLPAGWWRRLGPQRR